MTRLTAFITPIFVLALASLLWLGSLAPALAATVTDTFQLKLIGTERCRNNPNFVEPFTVKFKEGATLALTRDDTGVLTDVQATIDNSNNATIAAITLNGRAFFKNTSKSKAELALSGRDPGNPDRFLTLRGTATFNQAGTLTTVTGTYVCQILSDSGGVPNSDCLGSGTFGTGQKAVPRNFSVDATSSYTLFQQTSLWINRRSIRQTNFGTFVNAITYGDFDQDGDSDVFISSSNGTQNQTPVERYLNNGSGVFSLDTTWFGGTPPGLIHPRKALSGDFNGDGKLDVFILGHGYDQPPFPGEAPVLILSSPGGDVIAPGLNNLVGFHHGGAAADIDADGDLDVFVSVFPELSPFFLINNGQGQFTVDTTRLASDLVGRQLYSSELVDVDKDGYVDLLVGGHEQDGMSTYICWGDSTGLYSAAKATTIAAVPNEGVVLDFDAEDIDGDGDRDLVVTRTGDGKGTLGFYQGYYLQILENVSDRQFTDQTAQKIVAGSNSSGGWFDWIRLHDQNGDGHRDIVVDDAARNLVWYFDTLSGQFKR
jgi:hypothetical protein